MPTPSSILDRPEFAVLRLFTAEQLRRIRPYTAKRLDPHGCPLAEATGQNVVSGSDVACACGHGAESGAWWAIRDAAEAFRVAWDFAYITADELAEAVAAALAEREAADGNG